MTIGLRVEDKHEVQGLDINLHEESGYRLSWIGINGYTWIIISKKDYWGVVYEKNTCYHKTRQNGRC
jgi:hypothetical protein